MLYFTYKFVMFRYFPMRDMGTYDKLLLDKSLPK